MSEDFDFNPNKKDDKGIGKIHLDGDGKPVEQKIEEQKKQASTIKKWAIIGVAGLAGLAAILGISGVFNHHAANNNTVPTPTAVTETYHPPVQQQLPPVVQQVTADQVRAESIAQKQSVIYRDESLVYKQTDGRNNFVGYGEAYLNANGQSVGAGQDFAVHASLFEQGGISILVASGPYAGSRVEFFPVNGGSPTISYSHVGHEVIGADGRTTAFEALPQAQRTHQTVAMNSPAVAGSGVSVPGGAWTFNEMVQEHGNSVRAFTVRGDVNRGIINVKIWNGDSYTVNLANGEYTVDSVFLFHPNYLQEAQHGVTVDAKTIPLVKGVLNVAPAAAPTQSAPRLPAPGNG